MTKESIDILIENLSVLDYIKVTKEITDLQLENKRLKEQLCSRSDCSGRIKNSKKNDSLQQRINKAKEYIELCWNTEDIDGYISYDLSKEEVKKLLEILNNEVEIIDKVNEMSKGDNNDN